MTTNAQRAKGPLGAPGSLPRAEHDLYTTKPSDFRRFLERLREDGVILREPVLEPAAGLGSLSSVLIENGLETVSFDLIDRSGWEHRYEGIDIGQRDFLAHPYDDVKPGSIVTNPPFTHCLRFAEKGLGILPEGGVLAMLTRIQFLEGIERFEFFRRHPQKHVYVYSSRISCLRNGYREENAIMCYVWNVWEKGYTGSPSIGWIRPERAVLGEPPEMR